MGIDTGGARGLTAENAPPSPPLPLDCCSLQSPRLSVWPRVNPGATLDAIVAAAPGSASILEAIAGQLTRRDCTLIAGSQRGHSPATASRATTTSAKTT